MKRKPKERYLKKNFEPVVKKSRSLKEVLENLGIICRGGSYATIKKYIKLYEIDISHFYTKEELYKKTLGCYISQKWKKSLDEILVINSTYKNSNHLKERLYKEGLKKRMCEECEQGEEWRGKKIALILDHINGNPTDNRIENLQILCPNCNAATKTFSRGHKRMKKKENYCSCGKIINKSSKSCVSCESKKSCRRKVKDRPLYEQLKSDVEENGYKATGRKYGVADNTIRKWLKNKQMQL